MHSRLLLLLFVSALLFPSGAEAYSWQLLEPGLELRIFDLQGEEGTARDSSVVAVRFSPEHYSLRLLCARGESVPPMPAYKWSQSFNLSVVINASMYLKDGFTSTGFMRNARYVNNSHVNPRFGSFLLFDPLKRNLPPVRLIDRKFHDWKSLITDYSSVVQNFRMLSASRENLWKPGGEATSIACVGMDTRGRVLFILSRKPHTVHDFNEILLSLPLNLTGAMYVEGGPEAQLYVSTPNFEKGWSGMYGLNMFNDKSPTFLAVPNVLAAVPRQQ